MRMLALLEAFDRNGAQLGRLAVTQWPVTVGRSLASDFVLDDPHIAPAHLRIDRPLGEGGAPGAVTVDVLDTRNGVDAARKRRPAGDRFEWDEGQELSVGRLRLVLRLPETPISAEQPLPRFPWMGVGYTVLGLLLMIGSQLLRAWLESDETRRFLQQLPFAALYLFGSVALWAGLWALATKLFSGRLHFWRHVRIASYTFFATQVLTLVASLVAFMLSFELVSRFAWIGVAVVVAVGIGLHLLVIAPRRRGWIAGSLVALLLLGVPGIMTSLWLQNRRLSNELYMSLLFPPDWRAAPTVPVPQFMAESNALKARVDERLKAAEDEDAAEAGGDDDDD